MIFTMYSGYLPYSLSAAGTQRKQHRGMVRSFCQTRYALRWTSLSMSRSAWLRGSRVQSGTGERRTSRIRSRSWL